MVSWNNQAVPAVAAAMRNAFRSLAAFKIVLLTATLSGYAATGQLAGTVIDANTGATVPFSTVQIVGTTLGTVADSAGSFTVTVDAGTISILATALGYQPRVVSDIVISPVRPAVVRIVLIPDAAVIAERITVRPDFFDRATDAPLSTTSQSAEEIRRLPGGFEDVVRAISIVPGVAQTTQGRNDLIVRGGAPSENLYLIDNIEVNNINHFGTQGSAGGPISFINLDFVDNTTFSAGGFGARYGDRLSSTLAINLRDGRRDRFGGRATISATRFGIDAEGPLGERGSFVVSARRSYLDLIFRANGFEFVPEFWDFLARAELEPTPRDKFSLLAIGAINNVRLFNDEADDRFDNSRRLDNDQNQAVTGVSWRRLLGSGFITTTLSQTFVDYEFTQRDSLLTPFFVTESTELDIALRVDGQFQVSPETELWFGVQGKIQRADGDLLLRDFADPYSDFTDTFNIEQPFDTTGTKLAVYTQLSQRLGSLTLTAGVRGDYFSLIDAEPEVAPRLSASWEVASPIRLSVSAGRYYQAPSIIWIAANEFNRGLRQMGTDQVVAGIEIRLRDDTKFRVEGYYKDYFDYATSIERPYLVMANSGGDFGGSEEGFASFGLDSLVSAGEGRAYGVEFFLQKKLSEIPCYGQMSLTIGQVEYAGIDGIYRDGSFDQRVIFNIGGGYIFNERWEVSTKFQISTGRPYTPFEADGSRSIERYNSVRLGPSHALDLRVDRRWFFGGWVLTTYLDLQNVYARSQPEIPFYNVRTGQAETEDGLGLLPSIGITAEF